MDCKGCKKFGESALYHYVQYFKVHGGGEGRGELERYSQIQLQPWQTKISLANSQQDITVRYIVTQMDALSLKRLTYWPVLS